MHVNLYHHFSRFHPLCLRLRPAVVEQVIRFMADVDFKYSAKRSDLVMVTQYDKHQRAQNRLEWVRAGPL